MGLHLAFSLGSGVVLGSMLASPALSRPQRERAVAGRAASELNVEMLDRASALRELPTELDGLARRALEPNLFAEAPAFLAGLEHMDPGKRLSIVCVRDASGRLQGVFPFVCAPLFARGGPKVLRNWTHHNCSLGTPLVDAEHAGEALTALARWLQSREAPAGAIRWTKLSWDGPFVALLRETAARHDWPMDVVVSRRAMLLRGDKAAVSAKHAKELRRLERRLADEGEIAYAALGPGDDLGAWFADFLAVEAKGWKGAEGSAIASRLADTAFFRSLVRQAHASGRLQLLRLTVGGRVVAMKLNLRSGDTSYSLKIGHDEAYARFSPGVLLELFNIRAFDGEPAGVVRMDSCAIPNHPMIDRLWSGRREIATVTIARRGLMLRALVRSLPKVRALRAAVARLRRPEARP